MSTTVESSTLTWTHDLFFLILSIGGQTVAHIKANIAVGCSLSVLDIAILCKTGTYCYRLLCRLLASFPAACGVAYLRVRFRSIWDRQHYCDRSQRYVRGRLQVLPSRVHHSSPFVATRALLRAGFPQRLGGYRLPSDPDRGWYRARSRYLALLITVHHK